MAMWAIWTHKNGIIFYAATLSFAIWRRKFFGRDESGHTATLSFTWISGLSGGQIMLRGGACRPRSGLGCDAKVCCCGVR